MSNVVIDDLISDFESLRKHCDNVDFKGHTNPVDNVFYPGVSLDIPDSVRVEIVDRVESYFDKRIEPGSMFMRLSKSGTDAPHQAHTDASMASFGMMFYLNRLEDCLGGTSFVIHKSSGMFENPVNEQQEMIWKQDTNNPEAWQILDMVSMRPNRAMIFDTDKMHRSEPIGGFGDGAENGRLVLVFFFDFND